MSRVVITDAAVICPIGNTPKEVMANLDMGTTGLGRLGCFDCSSLPVSHAAEVRLQGAPLLLGCGIDRKEYFLREACKRLIHTESFLRRYPESKRFIAVGAGLDYFNLPGYVELGKIEDHRKWLNYSRCTNTIVQDICAEYGFGAGSMVNVSACVASSQAIGISFRKLRHSGSGNLIVTGGFDSMLNPFHYMGFYKLGALSTWEGPPEQSCRPFDKNRSGLVLGEGAALYALQALEDAAPDSILAEIVGYASTCDGHMVTDPDPEGRMLAKAALSALGEAGLTPDQIDCVHLHGTGTLKNDPAEANALKLVFGERFRSIPVYSMKGQIGHLIAACGAVEIMGVLYSIAKQKVPVTVNCTEPDPEILLRVVRGKPLEMEIKNVLKLNSAFGGQNTALVVKKYEK